MVAVLSAKTASAAAAAGSPRSRSSQVIRKAEVWAITTSLSPPCSPQPLADL